MFEHGAVNVPVSIASQMLASEALKAHFEDNPRDLSVLRHDKPLQPNSVQCAGFPGFARAVP